MSDPTNGHQFVFLLIGTFRKIIDELHVYLAENDFAETRPMHGFALQAMRSESISITELGCRLGVSKQAAAKTVKQLEAQQLIERAPNPDDARASLIRRSNRGDQLLRASADFFVMRQSEWEQELGEIRFENLLSDLATIGSTGNPGNFVGWLQSRPVGP